MAYLPTEVHERMVLTCTLARMTRAEFIRRAAVAYLAVIAAGPETDQPKPEPNTPASIAGQPNEDSHD